MGEKRNELSSSLSHYIATLQKEKQRVKEIKKVPKVTLFPNDRTGLELRHSQSTVFHFTTLPSEISVPDLLTNSQALHKLSLIEMSFPLKTKVDP